MSERFNTAGANGRDCPICFRIGTLIGARDGDAPRLTCSGCATLFTLAWGDGVTPDTLTRLPAPPVRRLTLEELERARGGAG